MNGNGSSKTAIPTIFKDITTEIPEELQAIMSSQDEFVDYLRETTREKFHVRIKTSNSWSFAGEIETPIEITDLIDRFGNEYLLFSRPKMQIKEWSKTLNLREHPYKKTVIAETVFSQPVVKPENSAIEQLTGMFQALLEKQEKQHREMLALQERLLSQRQTPDKDIHQELEKQITLFERFAKLQNPAPVQSGLPINDLMDVKKVVTQAVQLGMSLKSPSEAEPEKESLIEKLIASPLAPKILDAVGNLLAPSAQGNSAGNREAELVAIISKQNQQIQQLNQYVQQKQQPVVNPVTVTQTPQEKPEKNNVVSFPVKQPEENQEMELLKIRNIINEIVALPELNDQKKDEYYKRFETDCPKMLQELIEFKDGTSEQIEMLYQMTNYSENFAEMINHVLVKNGKEIYFQPEHEEVTE